MRDVGRVFYTYNVITKAVSERNQDTFKIFPPRSQSAVRSNHTVAHRPLELEGSSGLARARAARRARALLLFSFASLVHVKYI